MHLAQLQSATNEPSTSEVATSELHPPEPLGVESGSADTSSCLSAGDVSGGIGTGPSQNSNEISLISVPNIAHDDSSINVDVQPTLPSPRPSTRRYVNLTQGQWTLTELETLAYAELSLGEVYSIVDVLATKFLHRSKDSIEKIRKQPRYTEILATLRTTHTGIAEVHILDGPSYSHCRWSDSELIALAKREVNIGNHKRINESLHEVFSSRTVSSISQVRRTTRYQDILQLLQCETVVPPPALPSFSGNISPPPLELSAAEVRLALSEVGITNEALVSSLVAGPTSMDDLRSIYKVFGVKQKSKSKDNFKCSTATQQTQNRSQRKRARYVEHQKLYHLGPKVLADHLLIGDSSATCSLHDLHKEFDPIFNTYSTPLSSPLEASLALEVDESLFTEGEVMASIRLLSSKSSSGPDNVPTSELLKIPPSILTHIFNNWIAFGLIPIEMKQSRTVFIPKKSNPGGPGDYRPISVSPVLFRLFSKLLLCRLSATNHFHKYQSGFAEDCSTSSNLLVLQGIMRTLKLRHKPFFAVSLDLRKAFDSVSHSAIFSALEARSVPIRIINLIKHLYTNCTTTFTCGGISDNIRVPLRRGIKQGDPLSPFLFNCIIDPLLYRLNELGVGVPLEDTSMAAMAFADDLLLMSDTFEGLKLLLDETVSFLHNVDLHINPSKSQYFGWRPNHSSKGFDYNIPTLSILGQDVLPKRRDEAIRYLGLDLFINKNPTVHSTKALRLLELIAKASLKPFQKINCLRQLIVPVFLYSASNSLEVSSESCRLDGLIRKWIKKILHLPPGFPNIHIWLPSKSGGLGVIQLHRVAQAVQFKGLARLLRMGDAFVDNLFDSILNRTFQRLSELFQVPSGITSPKAVDAALQRGSHKWWSDLKSKYNNKDLFAHNDQAIANTWLYHDSKLLKEGDRLKALRLRTNLYPTRSLTNKQSSDPTSRLCRRCHEKPETTFHILQECESVHLARTERHNFVATQVARLVREKNPDVVVREEPRLTTREGTRLKPDLVIESDGEVLVVDVAVVWDANEGVLKDKARQKASKYDVLKGSFDVQKSFSSQGMVFGARSMVCRETSELARALGLSRADLAWLSASVLRGSLICLNRFRKRV